MIIKVGQGEMDGFTWEGQNGVAVSELGCENPWGLELDGSFLVLRINGHKKKFSYLVGPPIPVIFQLELVSID